MQIIIYAMPAIALYLALSGTRPQGMTDEFASLVPILFSLALLGVLLLALWKWQRKRTIKRRNRLLACTLVACFLGSVYIAPTMRFADHLYSRLLSG